MSYEGFGFPSSRKTESFNSVRVGGDPDPNSTTQKVSLQVLNGTTAVRDLTSQDINNSGGIDTQTIRAKSRLETENSLDFYERDSFESTKRRWQMSIRRDPDDVLQNADLLLSRYDDFGIFFDNVWVIDYQTGIINFIFPLNVADLQVQNITGRDGDPLTITSAVGQDLILDSGSDRIRFSDDAALDVGSVDTPLLTNTEGSITIRPDTREVDFEGSALQDVTVLQGSQNQNLQIESSQDLSFVVGTGNVDFGTASIEAQEVVVSNVDTSTASVDTVFGKTDLNLRSNLGEVNLFSETSYGINLTSGSGIVNFNDADLSDVQQIFASTVRSNTVFAEDNTSLTLQTSGTGGIIMDSAAGTVEMGGADLLDVGSVIAGGANLDITSSSGSMTLSPASDQLIVGGNTLLFDTPSSEITLLTQNKPLTVETGGVSNFNVTGPLQVGSAFNVQPSTGLVTGMKFQSLSRRRVIPVEDNITHDQGTIEVIRGTNSELPGPGSQPTISTKYGDDFDGFVRVNRNGPDWLVTRNARYIRTTLYGGSNFFGGVATAMVTPRNNNRGGLNTLYDPGYSLPLNVIEGLEVGAHGVRIDSVRIPLYVNSGNPDTVFTIEKMEVVQYRWLEQTTAGEVQIGDQQRTVLAEDVSVPRTITATNWGKMLIFDLATSGNSFSPADATDICTINTIEVECRINRNSEISNNQLAYVVFPPPIIEYTEIYSAN